MDELQMDRVQQQQQEQQQQQQQQEQQQQQQQIHEHLVQLQNWDVAEGQTLENRRAAQLTYLIGNELQQNEGLRDDWKRRLESIQAEATASGTPVQIQKPAKKTFKQRWEEKRRIKAAKKISPTTDHYGVHMLDGIKDYKQQHKNSVTDEFTAEATRQGVDLRVLTIYCEGYKKNEQGEPLDAVQSQRKQRDEAFLNDYISKDAQRRKPHLDRMVKQVLNINLTMDMFTPEYQEYHSAEFHAKLDKMTYFQNVYNDPENRAYFDALPQIQKDLIQCKVFGLYAESGYAYSHMGGVHGINTDGGRYYSGEEAVRVKQQLTPIVETEMELLRDKMKEVKEQEQALLEQEFERRYAQKRDMLMQNSVNTKQQIETEHMKTDKGADMTNLGFTGYMAGFYIDSLAEYRKKIEDHPQEYAQNRQVIDTVYQQLFRSYDAIGDVHLKQMAAEYVSDDVKVLSEQDMTYVEKQMNRLASRNSGEAENDIVVLTEQTNGMLDILRSLLENKPMTEAGSQMMRQLGF